MRITCIQMDVAFARPEENFRQAEALVRQAAKEERPDVILLPELWNTGFFPKEGLDELADPDGQRTAALCGGIWPSCLPILWGFWPLPPGASPGR